MKSFPKIRTIVFLSGKCKININYLSVLTVLTAMALSGCKKDDGRTANSFPVNETFAAELMGKGIPADVAQFFAAARMETKSPNDTTCVYLQTFPNGASREMTLQVSPNFQYTPTPEELANTTPGSAPIYAFKYTTGVQADGSTKINMSYYVAKAGLTKGVAKQTQASSQISDQIRGISLVQNASGAIATDGAGISWTEVWKTGADVSIGSLIDWAKDSGIKVGPLGSLYALASALSSVTGALDLSKQINAWLAELEALEKCAANPTNQISRSDPNYSAATVARIQAARSELKQVNAVRFLNIMTEVVAGINPVTAVLSVGLKPAFLWSEQSLGNYSENTIMREARLAVVPCDDSTSLNGNIDVLWDCNDPIGPTHTVIHIVTKLKWVHHPTLNEYISQGTYTFEYTVTYPGCTDKKSAIGSIGTTGTLIIINDRYTQDLLGYGYIAGGFLTAKVAATYSCTSNGSGQENYTIDWLPKITGAPSTSGSYEGETTIPWCGGSLATGTEKIKWAFSVPPAK